MRENYAYAVARIRAKEVYLFGRKDLESLISLQDHDDRIGFLLEKNWGDGKERSLEDILRIEEEKIWNFIDEIIKDKSRLKVVRVLNDYNNLKAAIKKSSTNHLNENVFFIGGLLDYKTILKAVENKSYENLPGELGDVAKKATEAFLYTCDGQLCDLMIDKAALESIRKEGKQAQESIIKEYAETIISGANIKIAVRGCLTNKKQEFFSDAMIECESLDIEKLAKAALRDVDAIYDYLETTKLSDAVGEIKNSLSRFEKWLDNFIMNRIQKEKYNPFTISPIIAYILAKQNEIQMVRMIILLKLNRVDDEAIKERLREMYV